MAGALLRSDAVCRILTGACVQGDVVTASHLLIKHQGSRRPASWKDESGAEITKRSKEDARQILLAHKADIMGSPNPVATCLLALDTHAPQNRATNDALSNPERLRRRRALASWRQCTRTALRRVTKARSVSLVAGRCRRPSRTPPTLSRCNSTINAGLRA